MFLVSSSLLAWHYIPLKEYFQIYYAKHLETDTISSQICGGQCQPVISEEYMLSHWGWFGFVIKNICAPILYGFPSRKCISSASSSPASQPGKLLSSFTSLAALNSAVGRKDLNAPLSYAQCFSLRSVMVRAKEAAFLKIWGYQNICCLLSSLSHLGFLVLLEG